MRFQEMRRPGRAASGAMAAAAAVTLAAVGVVQAHADRPQPKDPESAQAIAELQAAIDLINEAESHVVTTRTQCRRPAPPNTTDLSDGAPSATVLNALAPLRRPQTPIDVVPKKSLQRGLLVESQIYAGYTRTVTAPNGQQFVIVPSATTPAKPRPASCDRAVRDRLSQRAAAKSKRLQRVALREYDRLARAERPRAATAPYDEVYLFSRQSDGSLGGGGGGGRFGYFLTHGNLGSSGTGSSSVVTGLLPDGVGSITMTFPKRVSRGRYYKPEVFTRTVVITAKVQDNVFSVRVPRSAPDAFPARAVWRSPEGRVVRVVKP